MAEVAISKPMAKYTVSSGFGPRAQDFHKGIDLAASVGTPIYAAAAGTVITANYSTSAGNWVVIQHPWGVTKYMHMYKTPEVKVGQRVKAGTKLGGVGTTGQSTGPHLHFQLESPAGTAIDPAPYLSGAHTPTKAQAVVAKSAVDLPGASALVPPQLRGAIEITTYLKENLTKIMMVVAGMALIGTGLVMLVFDVDTGKIVNTTGKVVKLAILKGKK